MLRAESQDAGPATKAAEVASLCQDFSMQGQSLSETGSDEGITQLFKVWVDEQFLLAQERWKGLLVGLL